MRNKAHFFIIFSLSLLNIGLIITYILTYTSESSGFTILNNGDGSYRIQKVDGSFDLKLSYTGSQLSSLGVYEEASQLNIGFNFNKGQITSYMFENADYQISTNFVRDSLLYLLRLERFGETEKKYSITNEGKIYDEFLLR